MDQNIWKKPLVGKLHESYVQRLTETYRYFQPTKKLQKAIFSDSNQIFWETAKKFYSKDIFNIYFAFLETQFSKNPKRVISILNEKNFDLGNAFLSLDRLNSESWHDSILPDNEYERMKFCDANLNPTYLKLVDGIYYHFIHILAIYSRLDRRKNIEGLDLFNCVEEMNYPAASGRGIGPLE